MASDITVDWSAIEAKDGKAMEKKAGKAKKLAASKTIANKFIEIMVEEIGKSSKTITENEIKRILENKFKLTSSTPIVGGSGKKTINVGFNLEFEFTGDKTLVSLAPGKHVENVVALFNNGYPTNNIDPKHPIKGYWKGRYLVLGPYSQQGAHFIGRALERFEKWAKSNGWTVTYTVDGIYNTSTS